MCCPVQTPYPLSCIKLCCTQPLLGLCVVPLAFFFFIPLYWLVSDLWAEGVFKVLFFIEAVHPRLKDAIGFTNLGTITSPRPTYLLAVSLTLIPISWMTAETANPVLPAALCHQQFVCSACIVRSHMHHSELSRVGTVALVSPSWKGLVCPSLTPPPQTSSTV